MSAVTGCRCLTCRPMLGNGPNHPRPRPAPPRAAWTLSAPIPDGGQLRAVAATNPGTAAYPPRGGA